MEYEHLTDRRIFERFKVNLPMVCASEETAAEAEVNAFDISAQGMGLVSDSDLVPGAKMNLTLRIPALDKEFPAHGTVVWSKKFYTRFRSGIQLDPACVMGVSTVLRMLHSLPV